MDPARTALELTKCGSLPFKCGGSKWRHAVSAKYTSDFKTQYKKKVKYLNSYIEYILKY